MATRRARTGSKRLAVRLHTPTGVVELAWPPRGAKDLGELQRRAIEWTHVVRNRARWIRSRRGAAEQDARAREFLALLGVDDPALRQLAAAGVVRVSIPWSDEAEAWEARILPWEFIISAATRHHRSDLVAVTRSLVRATVRPKAALGKVLFVESAPGRLGQEWDFDDERRLVQKFTRAEAFEHLVQPGLAELKAKVADFQPGIIHLAGFDTHQGLELAHDPRAGDTGDGYLMAAPGGIAVVGAGALAKALASGARAPVAVFCNFWNSAGRIAPLIVAEGAGAAVGFQDGIDDALAEIFLGSFYRGLAAESDVGAGFDLGWSALQSQPKPLRGTGIVLWSGLAKEAASTPQRPPPRELAAAAVATARSLAGAAIGAHEVRQLIAVTVEPETQFSYGLLHNNRDLFRRFLVRNLSDAPLHGLEVFVELHANEGTYPWRRTVSVEGPVLDLSREVRIALTSNLSRTLDELLRTSLYVRVVWGPHEVFSQTFPVTLAPVDQWADTDADRMFLPSFVFPRDAAVAKVIRNAEHFVTALRDDPTAGFDGYQALDPEAVDPAANLDRQVQALWYSLVYKVPASYINPPPTYAVASQRIRTPSEVVAGGYGTCIDLALMFAACLEAVEIHAVVFLLDDHAFPGYWRTDSAREAFLRRAERIGGAGTRPGEGAAASERPGVPWSFDAAMLEEIRRAIRANRLVPLESVGLTGRWGLGQGIEAAREYFEESEASRFLAMLDLVTAREQGVTPLPLGPRLGER
jgi:hypothetical protein